MGRGCWVAVVLAALVAAPALARGSAVGQAEVERMIADAEVLMGGGDLAGALTTALRACELAPDWPPVYATLGTLFQRQGDQRRATEHYARFQLFGLLERGAPDDDFTREIADAEATLVYLTNQERLGRGLPILRPDLALAEMARQHSEEMRDYSYFSHASPIRRNSCLENRFRNAFQAPPRAVAENLSRMRGTLWSFTPENIRDSHQRLMRSPGHCENILWDRPNRIGVGVAVSKCGDYWITQDFALLGQ